MARTTAPPCCCSRPRPLPLLLLLLLALALALRGAGAQPMPLDAAAQAAVLAAVNALRLAHQAPPVTWSAAAGAYAQAWAERLARDGAFEHSVGGPFGENLAGNWGADARAATLDAVSAWYAEEAEYDYRAPGFSAATGHFTALVWRSTARMGAGVARASPNDMVFVVMSFDPPGNSGDYAGNVLPRADGPAPEPVLAPAPVRAPAPVPRRPLPRPQPAAAAAPAPAPSPQLPQLPKAASPPPPLPAFPGMRTYPPPPPPPQRLPAQAPPPDRASSAAALPRARPWRALAAAWLGAAALRWALRGAA